MQKLNPHDIIVKSNKTFIYDDNSLSAHGPKLSDQLPNNSNPKTYLFKFREYTKTWFGPKSGYEVPSDLNVEQCS